MKKRIFLLLIAFSCVLFSIPVCPVNAQELQSYYNISPYVTGFQAHNYFYACGYALPGQGGNPSSEHTRFSWHTYSDYTIDPLRHWSFSGGRGILINTGLLGLSGEAITGISISAVDLQNNVATLSLLGNINLPGWNIIDKTVDTSSAIYAPEFLTLNNRTPEQFFDNIVFSFASDGTRYDFPISYVAGDAIVVKYSFSIPHYVRYITLYGDESEYQLGYQDGYQQGLSDGYDSGYSQGYNVGYNDGYNAGISSTITPNWFTSFVSSVFDIFNIEIFPNVKLIYLFFIPIGLGIVLLILKLIRG